MNELEIYESFTAIEKRVVPLLIDAINNGIEEMLRNGSEALNTINVVFKSTEDSLTLDYANAIDIYESKHQGYIFEWSNGTGVVDVKMHGVEFGFSLSDLLLEWCLDNRELKHLINN